MPVNHARRRRVRREHSLNAKVRLLCVVLGSVLLAALIVTLAIVAGRN